MNNFNSLALDSLLLKDNALKFTAYLLSRKHVQQPRSASQLFSALHTLSRNSVVVPVAITSSQPSQVLIRCSRRIRVFVLLLICIVLMEHMF